VGFYTRHQVVLLLVLLATVGLGMAVQHWRRTNPEIVERIEQLDREPARGSSSVAGPAAGRATRTRPAEADAERRRGERPSRVAAPRSAPVPPEKFDANDVSAIPAAPLDINLATAEELTRLPGVGAVLAARIVEARETEPFSSVEDLRRVRGVGRAKFERLRAFVAVVSEPRASASAGLAGSDPGDDGGHGEPLPSADMGQHFDDAAPSKLDPPATVETLDGAQHTRDPATCGHAPASPPHDAPPSHGAP
jgi:competence ComEA-like helix-hairpin-helix protein